MTGASRPAACIPGRDGRRHDECRMDDARRRARARHAERGPSVVGLLLLLLLLLTWHGWARPPQQRLRGDAASFPMGK
eukprot:scaffold3519_cov175-Prasinococcus_capsulatus_cf.AAC.1